MQFLSSLIGVKFGYLPICRSSRLILSGFSGAGKSAIAQICASKFRWRLFDFDTWIHVKTGKSLTSIIENEIADAKPYSNFYSAYLSDYHNEITKINNAIITVPFNFLNLFKNSVKLYNNSFLAWIDTDVDLMWRRALEQEHNRLLYKDQENFNQIYKEFLPSYKQSKAIIYNQQDLQLTYMAVQHAFRAF